MIDSITVEFSTALHGSAKIRWVTRSQFSHIDVVVHDGLLGASDNPTAPVVRGNPRGVAVRPHNYQKFGLRHRVVIPTPLAPYIIAKGESQLGKPFDQRALYAIYLPWLRAKGEWKQPESWYCMELVVWMFDGEHGPERTRFFPYDLAVTRNLVVPEDGLLIFNPFWSSRAVYEFSES